MEILKEINGIMSFGLYQCQVSTLTCSVILSLALQFVAIRQAPYAQDTALYNRSH
jgi:hypothetical protein